MQLKKIVLDLRSLQCGYSNKGIGRYTREIVRRLQSETIEFHGLILRDKPNPFPEIPVLISVPLKKRPWLWDQTILPYQLWRNKVNLFHNFSALGPLPQISFPIIYAPRSIVTIYDLHLFEKHASPVNKFYRNTMRIKLQALGLPRVYKCIADSEKAKADIIKFTSLKESKIDIINPGCEHIDNISNNAEVQSRTNKHFIFSFGGTANKNSSLAYDVLKELRLDIPDIEWIICGNKEQILSHTKIAAADFKWVTFIDSISDNELINIYKKAELLLFPSTEEGFGIPLIEAMRSLCPVVTGNINPMKTITGFDSGLSPIDSSSGSIKDWKSACLKIIQDPGHKKVMVENGLKQSEKFLWDTSAKKILELYEFFFEKQDKI